MCQIFKQYPAREDGGMSEGCNAISLVSKTNTERAMEYHEETHGRRPALWYGAETRALKKAQDNTLNVAEMRMLRCMCGVTELDKIGHNKRITGTTKVGEIAKKVQERRLKWYEHVTKREAHYTKEGVRRKLKFKGEGREEDLIEDVPLLVHVVCMMKSRWVR